MENLFRDETKKIKKRKKSAKAKLSFAMDDDEEEVFSTGNSISPSPAPKEPDHGSERQLKRAKLAKNPNVDTSFLPDREREEAERKERERLRQEWLRKQEELKAEEIEVTYSFWDGSGHRKSVTVSGTTFRLQYLT